MFNLADTELLAPVDDFDPRTWAYPSLTDPYHICLSDNRDVHVLLDYQDYLWAREFKWRHTYGSGQMTEKFEGVYVIGCPDHMYAIRDVVDESGKRGLEYLHRAILKRAEGTPRYRRAVGDHKNGKTLDCRRMNLRWATPSMNARNTPSSKVRAKFLKQMGVV